MNIAKFQLEKMKTKGTLFHLENQNLLMFAIKDSDAFTHTIIL